MADRKRIFQVAYREEHFLARADLLRRQGYTVTSTIGNEAAKAVLPMLPQVDLLIIGHAAPEQTRLEMVAWLSERYPRTSILALNPSHERLGTLPLNAVHYRTPGLAALDRGGIGLSVCSAMSKSHHTRPPGRWGVLAHSARRISIAPSRQSSECPQRRALTCSCTRSLASKFRIRNYC